MDAELRSRWSIERGVRGTPIRFCVDHRSLAQRNDSALFGYPPATEIAFIESTRGIDGMPRVNRIPRETSCLRPDRLAIGR